VYAIVVENDDVTPSGITPEYDVCHEFPTCLMCIGSAVDYLPRFAYETVGEVIVNAATLKKLDLKFRDG
jgi:hypothetical protein